MGKNNKPLEWKEVECQYPELGMCWEVTSHALNRDGYAHITRNGVSQSTHRFIWEQCFGEIPEGMVVMHKCDNKKCINPEHLKLGTQQENMKDMVEKDRSMKGEKNYSSKLTDEQIRAIRADNRTLKEIAEEYGVGKGTIGDIKNRKCWKHVI